MHIPFLNKKKINNMLHRSFSNGVVEQNVVVDGPIGLSGDYGPAETTLKSGIKLGYCSLLGRRERNEDRIVVVDDVKNLHLQEGVTFSCLTVMDGHGGNRCADFMGKILPKQLDHLTDFGDESLINLVRALECLWHDECVKPPKSKRKSRKRFSMRDDSGTTLTCCLIVERCRKRELISVQLGDSRAILVDTTNGELQQLTQDHKPDDPDEKKRILKSGGCVIQGYVNGGLAMSRSLGDVSFKNLKGNSLVSYTPTITRVKLSKNKSYMLALASDGVFDVFENEELADAILEKTEAYGGKMMGIVVEDILKQSIQRGSADNCTLLYAEL